MAAASPPGLPRTSVDVPHRAGAVPPGGVVVVPVNVAVVVSEVQHHTQTAPVFPVAFQFHGTLPAEVLVVKRVVGVEPTEVLGQRPRTLEVVDVNERIVRNDCFVILFSGAHNHRNYVVAIVKRKQIIRLNTTST